MYIRLFVPVCLHCTIQDAMYIFTIASVANQFISIKFSIAIGNYKGHTIIMLQLTQ